jgi:hypothetical protein
VRQESGDRGQPQEEPPNKPNKLDKEVKKVKEFYLSCSSKCPLGWNVGEERKERE